MPPRVGRKRRRPVTDSSESTNLERESEQDKSVASVESPAKAIVEVKLEKSDFAADVLVPKPAAEVVTDVNREIAEAQARYSLEQKQRLKTLFEAYDRRGEEIVCGPTAVTGLTKVSFGQDTIQGGAVSCSGCSLAAIAAFVWQNPEVQGIDGIVFDKVLEEGVEIHGGVRGANAQKMYTTATVMQSAKDQLGLATQVEFWGTLDDEYPLEVNVERGTYDFVVETHKSPTAKFSLAAVMCNVVDALGSGLQGTRCGIDFAVGDHHVALLLAQKSGSEGLMSWYLYNSLCPAVQGASLLEVSGYTELKQELKKFARGDNRDFTATLLCKGGRRQQKRVTFQSPPVGMRQEQAKAVVKGAPESHKNLWAPMSTSARTMFSGGNSSQPQNLEVIRAWT